MLWSATRYGQWLITALMLSFTPVMFRSLAGGTSQVLAQVPDDHRVRWGSIETEADAGPVEVCCGEKPWGWPRMMVAFHKLLSLSSIVCLCFKTSFILLALYYIIINYCPTTVWLSFIFINHWLQLWPANNQQPKLQNSKNIIKI